MNDPFAHRSWKLKFLNAFRGLKYGLMGQKGHANSFLVHGPIAVLVIVIALWLELGYPELAVLLLCIGVVFTAELFNSSLESLSRAVTRDHNEDVRVALDVASAAVLMASLTAAVVGAVILFKPLMLLLS